MRRYTFSIRSARKRIIIECTGRILQYKYRRDREFRLLPNPLNAVQGPGGAYDVFDKVVLYVIYYIIFCDMRVSCRIL